MPVKIDPEITAELQAMDLVLWEARHQKLMVWNEAKGKLTPREDKSRTIVTITGPGVDECYGSGKTLREAVDTALRNPAISDRVPGLKGALLRCEEAMFKLWLKLREDAYDRGDDDDIPF